MRTFEALVRGVEKTLLEGRRQIEQATVFGNWETGRLINEHILLNRQRAGYAEGVISRLARRVAISERVLYHCGQFHRRYPNLNTRSKLTWSHFRALCQVDDDQRRATLAHEAEKRDWTVAQLEQRVRQFNLASAETSPGIDRNGDSGSGAFAKPALLTAKHGTPGLYKVAARGDNLALDLGFKVFLPLPATQASRLKLNAADIVRATDSGTFVRDDDASNADLFTYRALEVRVVDGDTLAVTIALPPHNEIDKKLRLRAIDCPEIATSEGKAASRFVQDLIDTAKSITLTTTKPDKYDRYLADVFLESRSGESVFLNNALLQNQHARRSDGTRPPDWIP